MVRQPESAAALFLCRLLVLVTLGIALVSSPLLVSGRTSIPAPVYTTVAYPVLSLNVSTPHATAGTLSSSMVYHPPANGGFSLPAPTRADGIIEFNVMRPHIDDAVDACSAAWRTENEFNQSFAGAYVLVMQNRFCTGTAYTNAAASGAAGLLFYGCPGEAPYSCETRLVSPLVIDVITIPILGLTTADGASIVSFLGDLFDAATASSPPPLDSVTFSVLSSGSIDATERAALIAIMSKSIMFDFAYGTVTQGLDNWSLDIFTNTSRDPCTERVIGLWCEAGHIVVIDVVYHFWASYTGVIPSEFGAFSKLRYISLLANSLLGSVPDEWCELTDLRVLWIGNQYYTTGISGLPNCLASWSELEDINIGQSAFTTLPSNFTQLTKLRRITANQNSLTDFPSLMPFVNLSTIDLSSNLIATRIPELNPAAPLQVFGMGNNQLSGTIPVDLFDDYTDLTIVDLNTNLFTGALPNFKNCAAMTILDLGSQRQSDGTGGFNSSMPTTWSVMTSLTTLYLQENSLVSPMMANLMTSLQYIDVSHNRLTTAVSGDLDNTDVATFLNSLTTGSIVSIKASYNNIVGANQPASLLLSSTLQELYLDHNGLTTIWSEFFTATPSWTQVDFSYNNLSLPSGMPSGTPSDTFVLLNFTGNPLMNISELPSWAELSTDSVQQTGTNYTCAPILASAAPLFTLAVDPTFYGYANCECAAGTFGKPPNCISVPNAAELNPYSVITSAEVGSDFSSLIVAAAGVGSDLYAADVNITSVATEEGAALFSQAFSDSMYGEDRLTLGMSTSWVIDLTTLYADNPEAYTAAELTAPTTVKAYVINSSSTVSSLLTGVRAITIRLHISQDVFTEFEDVLSVYEGDSDLKGTRVLTVRGTDDKTPVTYSDYAQSAEYVALYNASLAQVSNATLIEVRVFSSEATVQFTSRATSGLHFFSTYSYAFVCPDGYFFDTTATPNACTSDLEQFEVSPEIRDAVFAVTALALAFVLANMVVLAVKWESPVFKAASRPFMLLILVLLLVFALGAMLYAAIPTPGTKRGDAVCFGRAWLSCLPLAGVLSILLAKTARLDAIFGARTLQVKKHSDMDILRVVAVVCTLQIAMLAVFTGLPLSRAQLAQGKGSQSDEMVISCSQESGFMSWIGAEIAFIGCLIIPTAYLGFKTRDLPSQYNESQHIQNAVVLLLFFGCIIIPLDIFIQNNPEAAVLIQGLGQAFLCIMLTCIIFGPKLYYVAVSNNRDPRDQTQMGGATSGDHATSSPAGRVKTLSGNSGGGLEKKTSTGTTTKSGSLGPRPMPITTNPRRGSSITHMRGLSVDKSPITTSLTPKAVVSPPLASLTMRPSQNSSFGVELAPLVPTSAALPPPSPRSPLSPISPVSPVSLPAPSSEMSGEEAHFVVRSEAPASTLSASPPAAIAVVPTPTAVPVLTSPAASSPRRIIKVHAGSASVELRQTIDRITAASPPPTTNIAVVTTDTPSQ